MGCDFSTPSQPGPTVCQRLFCKPFFRSISFIFKFFRTLFRNGALATQCGGPAQPILSATLAMQGRGPVTFQQSTEFRTFFQVPYGLSPLFRNSYEHHPVYSLSLGLELAAAFLRPYGRRSKLLLSPHIVPVEVILIFAAPCFPEPVGVLLVPADRIRQAVFKSPARLPA